MEDNPTHNTRPLSAHEHQVMTNKLKSLGPYELRSVIGQGGMGTVYLAEQIMPIRREVAIKVISIDLSLNDNTARFLAERQVLASLNHPNIAQVLDAGETPEGHIYLVMEYIEGESFLTFCDQQRLTIQQRLALFKQVCQAIQYAHQQGIIHRDLKSENILVSLATGFPVVKLIDFGISKSLGREDNYKTQTGHYVGTPVVMSPEQLLMPDKVDTRSDVYSLGILLYQLLSGVLPSTLKPRTTTHLAQLLQQPAPRMSKRYGLVKTDRQEIAQNRNLSSHKLKKLLSVDLDWIVHKAIEKEPERRYQSAFELLADIERYLSNNVVMARPPSKGYELKKLIQRQKLAASLIVLLIAGLSSATLISFKALQEEQQAKVSAQQAEKNATIEARKATAISKFLLDTLRAADASEKGINVKVIDLFDYATQNLSQFDNQPTVKASVLQVLGDAYMGLAQYQQGEELILQSIEILRKEHGADSIEALEAEVNLFADKLDYQPIVELHESIRSFIQKVSTILDHEHDLVLKARFYLASLLSSMGKENKDSEELAEAKVIINELINIRTRKYGSEDTIAANYRQILGGILFAQEDIEGALEAYQKVLPIAEKIYGRDAIATLSVLGNLGYVLFQMERFDEAIVIAEEVLQGYVELYGANHPNVLPVRLRLAQIQYRQGKLTQAKLHVDLMLKHLDSLNDNTGSFIGFADAVKQLDDFIEAAEKDNQP
ncbi:serine/threonine-protein kinase [Pleionea sp. CnH1-48]|uniref:serine/threonine protein kinase n=1 Tax=Pleionea sp. CnH1-48 TaxID=2954494 RepID=UPI002097B442|nr:serine/threonine-protein kinase [Pleionea sp. CnH1-48]MCO7222911.1 serine/threonine-protein kinase [Pleionea sp. CnH1-48]